MSSAAPHRHRYFSPVSYIALPYLAYLLVSGMLVDCCLPEKWNWFRFLLALTWLPAAWPLAVFVSGTGVPNATMIVLQIIFVVGDVYFWAWLVTKIFKRVAEIRRKEREYEERASNGISDFTHEAHSDRHRRTH
jgi:hypothetical protein